MADESKVIEYLRRFNRKERFILLNRVLGQQGGDAFRLNCGFRRELERTTGVEIPSQAFVAMDYHLDWIQMALYLAGSDSSHMGKVFDNANELIKGNQEDVDLLVAFQDEASKTHLLLVEAKADTGWTNKQLNSKACRLGRIFLQGQEVYGAEVVKPHFILMSPKPPNYIDGPKEKGIDTKDWPPWMKRKGEHAAHWLKLPLCDGLLRVTRWDKTKNKSSKHGDGLLIRRSESGKWRRWIPPL